MTPPAKVTESTTSAVGKYPVVRAKNDSDVFRIEIPQWKIEGPSGFHDYRKLLSSNEAGTNIVSLSAKLLGEMELPDMGPSREEIDAKLERTEARMAASEQRIERQFSSALAEVKSSNSEMRAELQLSHERLSANIEKIATELRTGLAHVPTSGAMYGAVVGSTLATIGVLLGVLAFGGDRFDGGVQVSSVSVQQAEEARKIANENSEQVRAISQAMDQLLLQVKLLNEKPASPGTIPDTKQ